MKRTISLILGMFLCAYGYAQGNGYPRGANVWYNDVAFPSIAPASMQCVVMDGLDTTTPGMLSTQVCGIGTVQASPQFQLPYYDQSGSNAHVKGDSGITTDGGGSLSTGAINSVLNPASCAQTLHPAWCSGSDMGAWIDAAIQHLPAAPVGGEVDIPTDPTGCWAISTEVVVDRPITIRGQNWTFNSNGGTCFVWSGGSSPVFEVNGASRASSNSILENFSLTNSGTGTIGIDINGGQYNVIVRNVSVVGGAVRFSAAGIRVGSDTASYPDGDITLENVRVGYQTTGVDVLYANTFACLNCHVYSNNVANVQIGDSGHIVFNAIFEGGDIEQDDTSAPSFLLTNVDTLNLLSVYSELAAASQSVIALTSDCAHIWNVRWAGGYINMNGYAGSLLNTEQTCSFPSSSYTLNNLSVTNTSSGASIVRNTAYSAPSGISLRDITSDTSTIVVSNTTDAYMDLKNVLGITAPLLNDTGTLCWENYAGTGQSCLSQNSGYNLVYTWAIYAGAGIGPNIGAPGITWTEGSGAPIGSCGSGAIYSNSAGTTSGNDNLYVCSQSSWVAVK